MFYRTEKGIPENPTLLNALVVPRPIGWISTVDGNGVANLAPYSFFNAVAYKPPQVMFSATSNHVFGGLKDSVKNAQETGEFVVNLATYKLREQMNASSVAAPSDVDEFEHIGLNKAKSELVKAPRVAESPVHLECQYVRSIELESLDPKTPNTMVIGKVIGIHVEDQYLKDGVLDTLALEPVGRLGSKDYVKVDRSFSIERPESWK